MTNKKTMPQSGEEEDSFASSLGTEETQLKKQTKGKCALKESIEMGVELTMRDE